jgi:hypothetical protein
MPQMTSPSTGARLEWTLNTFMKTLIFNAGRFAKGSSVFSTMTIRPSAGAQTRPGSAGTLRGGSLKNCSTNKVANQNGNDHQIENQETTSETATAIARKGQPSLAMMGCG